PPPIVSSVMVLPTMLKLPPPTPNHRVGFPAASVGVAVRLKVANVPLAVMAPSVPGALLRVKLKSLTAWAELMIVLAPRWLVIVTASRPLVVAKSALAESGTSVPDPLALKVIDTAAAG